MTTIIILIQAIIEEVKNRGIDIQLNYTDIDEIQKNSYLKVNKKTPRPGLISLDMIKIIQVMNI